MALFGLYSVAAMTPSQTPSSAISCRLCNSSAVRPILTDEAFSRTYTAYWCDACDLMQTLGDVQSISPDYVDLVEEALDDAHIYVQTEHKRPAFEQWLRLFRQRSPSANSSPFSVMDVGCGVGGFLDFVRLKGAETYGFDVSKVQVQRAQQKHPRTRLASSLEEYAALLGDQPSVGAITMWDVFEHIRNPVEFLQQLRSACHADTLVYVSVPSGAINPLKCRVARWRGRSAGLIPWEHVFYYTKQSLPTVFDRGGFEVLEIGSVAAYRRAWSAHEMVRRIAHGLLAPTPYSFQIYALARVKPAAESR